MKFNFIEIGSKQLFIKNIGSSSSEPQQLSSPSQAELNSLDANIRQGKKIFKEIKEGNTKLFQEIVQIVSEVTTVDEKFQETKKTLVDLLQDMESRLKNLLDLEESILNSEKELLQHGTTMQEKIEISQDWFQQFRLVQESLLGFKVINIQNNQLDIQFTLDTNSENTTTNTVHVQLKFNSIPNQNRFQLISIHFRDENQNNKYTDQYTKELINDFNFNSTSAHDLFNLISDLKIFIKQQQK
ncbi:hypothetical protein DLAC_07249 [Tieghemostelium lacteum]|uniref:Uncharacterized protein n=1 Tax=Tieghemostelium lacteum TaxID=361077 RepID=A0A151ZC15_TIELA|nr:hypothetical protein DLAC_07249 [Tieghemostelium lacteum]|eukprot:KYQ91492.1 hypothetical protein DLAC_07249 [Tieghemostelium lacteum]